MALIAQGGPVVPRCVLEGTTCPEESGNEWILIALGAILVLILVVAVIQGIRYRRRKREDGG